MSSKKKTFKYRSDVWTFMNRVSMSEVCCKLCGHIFKYHRSTTCLWSHMKSKHSCEFQSMQSQSQRNVNETASNDNVALNNDGGIDYLIEIEPLNSSEITTEETNSEDPSSNSNKINKAWSLVQTISDSEVKCIVCSSILQCNRKSPSTLMAHMMALHAHMFNSFTPEESSAIEILQGIMTGESTNSTATNIEASQTPSTEVMDKRIPLTFPFRERSSVWQYMAKTAPDLVQCTLCQLVLKYHNSTTCMLKHLQAKHMSEFKQMKVQKKVSNVIKRQPVRSAPRTNLGFSSKPHHASSPVWKFMDKISEELVKCLICNSVFSYYKTTTSLITHMKARHPSEYDLMQPEKSNVTDSELDAKNTSHNSISQSPAVITLNSHPVHETRTSIFHDKSIVMERVKGKYKEGSDRKKHLDRLLIEMVTLDLQPLNLLDGNGFKKFINALDTKYALPTEQHLANTILPMIHSTEKDSLKLEILECSEVTIATEIWTSRYAQDYITVAVYYLSPDWEMRSAILETKQLATNHTTSDIAEELYKTINAWGLEQRISCVVTDNGVNIVAAVFLLDLPHVPCYAKTLNSVIQDSMKSVSPVYDMKKMVSNTATFFHQNSKAAEKLVNLQEAQNKVPLQMLQEVDRRWNSTYTMFERYIELYDPIKEILTDLEKHELIISSDELKTIKSCISILRPFDIATKSLLIDKFTPLSKVIPTTKAIRQVLSRNKDQDSTQRFAEELESQMVKAFDRVEEQLLFGASTLLDPRFKKFPFSSSAAADAIEVKLTGHLEQYSIKEENTTSELDSSATSVINNMDDEMLWSCFDQEMKENTDTSANVFGVDAQFRQLYEEGTLHRLGDPLVWWKKRECQFIKLIPLVRKYLSIPATHMPPERMFSDVGDKISQRRENLTDKAINEILFLNKRLESTLFIAD